MLLKNQVQYNAISAKRFGHGSNNCDHVLRCLKYSGEYLAKNFTKSKQDPPSCFNCGSSHMANFRGCPYYLHVVASTAPAVTKPLPPAHQKSLSSPETDNTITNYNTVKSNL